MSLFNDDKISIFLRSQQKPIVFYQIRLGESRSDRCLVVMMQASQACDPGSSPGDRTTILSFR